jgi:hypothetical protein
MTVSGSFVGPEMTRDLATTSLRRSISAGMSVMLPRRAGPNVRCLLFPAFAPGPAQDSPVRHRPGCWTHLVRGRRPHGQARRRSHPDLDRPRPSGRGHRGRAQRDRHRPDRGQLLERYPGGTARPTASNLTLWRARPSPTWSWSRWDRATPSPSRARSAPSTSSPTSWLIQANKHLCTPPSYQSWLGLWASLRRRSLREW